MSTHKTTVGIIGVGMVGRELGRYFREILGYERGRDIFLYDIDPKKSYADNVSRAEVIFISVPTPRAHDGSCNISAVESAIASIEGPHVVVIKSTVPPGTTKRLQKKHPEHKMLFNPEFLTESQAWYDMIRPDRQIVGFTERSIDAAHVVLSLLPKAPFMSPGGSGYKRHALTATEAELAKIFGNAFFSLKVTFANLMADAAMALGANYENARSALAADYRIGASHLDVLHGGYRGFGGYCLPKDIDALIASCKEAGVDPALLEAARDQNEKLLQRQGLTLAEVCGHNGESDFEKRAFNAPAATELPKAS